MICRLAAPILDKHDFNIELKPSIILKFGPLYGIL